MAKLYFATNRNPSFDRRRRLKDLGNRFNDQGPQIFRVGWAEVEGTDPLDDDGWRVVEKDLYKESAAENREVVGSAMMFEGLRKYLKKQPKDVIIYLHGFANDFDNSAVRAAQLEHLYGRQGEDAVVVFFGWPSNGKVFPSFSNYMSDRDDAEASGIAMARVLEKFVAFLTELREEDRAEIVAAQTEGIAPDPSRLKQCDRKLHLVAHSMGNWALRHAVLGFAKRHGGRRLPRIFDHAFLMAADEDADALGDGAKLAMLLDLATNIHVYHAGNDIPLEVSDKTKGNPDRLGSDGPDDLDTLHPRILTLDCTKVSDTRTTHGNHQYYRLRSEVISDVVATLRGKPQQGRANRVETRPGRSWRIIAGQTAET